MGDLIAGSVIVLLIIIAFILNRKSKQPNTEKFIRNLIGFGAVIGLLLSFTNSGSARALGLVLFYLQFTSIILLSLKKRTVGYLLLCLTLLLQIPILNLENFSYRSQTLFGINVLQMPDKHLDVDLEPGSYLNYFNIPHIRYSVEIFPLGINLLSLVLLGYFIYRLLTWKKGTTANIGFKL